ncbi:MAG: CHAT domain-containing protein, partial [Coleofasciculus sp. C1-SOL-03]|uniref:CHAT domain-containing protein n=1 Tax=Coleofasciculus sp. C1-SOL-03 TaxID=3069522 RepID=UPI0033023FAD
TRRLGASIAQLLNISPYFGKDALVSHLTQCQSPELLLIATHGYFSKSMQQPDYDNLILALLTCPNGQEATILYHNHKLLNETLLEKIETAATIFTKQGNPNPAHKLRTLIPQIKAIIQSPQTPSTSHPEDPMLRSALAFAGANRWLEGKPLPDAPEKGMVFAQDIAALDLWETELAILSACQTGIGDVKLGEGVFGLRRAFAIAGTKTLIMSLWSVPDRATALLMNRFLSNLRQGIGRRVALKEAQDYIRTITVQQLQESELGCSILAELEKALPQTRQLHPTDQPLAHPYFWGAWVCQGETKAVKLNRL